MIDNLKDKYLKIEEQIEQVCNKAGRDKKQIRLITVTKTRTAEVLQSVIDTGYPDIGENKVQEIVQKIPVLTGEKTVHMIGHLQSNKVSKVVPLVDWIHSIDSEKLLNKVEQYCENSENKMNILIQVNTSGEETKSGCSTSDALSLCEKAMNCANVHFRGFMTIGPLFGTDKEVRQCFENLRLLGEQCYDVSNKPIELSMGMSSDFQIAIEEGSTMIRIGTLILGSREY